MCATPAVIAGVKRIVLCSPSLNGKINGGVYYAAKILGIKEYYALGGAGAIAGLLALLPEQEQGCLLVLLPEQG